MNEFARIVLGYHGCLESRGARLVSGELPIDEWPASDDKWDWLGNGIYFWEHAPERAARWAQMKADKVHEKPYVVGAVIQLGTCFDLTNVRFTEMLRGTYDLLKDEYRARNKRLPTNRKLVDSSPDVPIRTLDCLVINRCLKAASEQKNFTFQTVRGAFWEGNEAFPGAEIQKESHIQIAVRDQTCILGVFRPRISW